MWYPLIACAVVFLLVSVGAGVEGQTDDVYMLGHYFDQYEFNCEAGQLAAFSEDKRSLLFYDIVNRKFVMQKNLSLPGELLKWSADGSRLVVTHDSYITVLYNGTMKITPVPVVQAISVVILDDLACLVPAFDQWVYMTCMNMTTQNVQTCTYQVYAGSLAFADPAKGWVYMMDEELEPQSMYKFNSVDGCLSYIGQNPDFGEFTFGSHIWYSYDGSRIFLDNGMSLTASSNPKTDMQVHGDFNSSYGKYHYTWFSQSLDDTHLITGLRSDKNDTVFYYTWPLLQFHGTKCIPLPKKATQVLMSEQVHACSENSLFVFSTYGMADATKETGVAYMTV